MEDILDEDYFNDKLIFFSFAPRQRKKVQGILESISLVIAHTPDGKLVVLGKRIEKSNIINLLCYELDNRQPSWVRGAVSAVINNFLDLSAFRAQSYRRKSRCRRQRRKAKRSTTEQPIPHPSVESIDLPDVRDKERQKGF